MLTRIWCLAAFAAFSVFGASISLLATTHHGRSHVVHGVPVERPVPTLLNARIARSVETGTRTGRVERTTETFTYSRIEAVREDDSYVPDHIQVLEDFLPEDAYHQEPGACQVGSKVWLVTGIAVPRAAAKSKAGRSAGLGGNHVHVFDMDTQTTAEGPPLPVTGNHMACAAAPDGTIYVSGGFRQDAPASVPTSVRSWRHHFSLDTTDSNATWVRRADLPEGRGGHGCAFLADGNMYCVGGGGGQWGPFYGSTFVYSPASDSWSLGPAMDVGRDHVSVMPLWGGQQLMAIGGRSDLLRSPGVAPHPVFWQTMDTVEVLDTESGEWMYAPSIPTVKAGAGVTTVRRRPSGEPNLLVVGGETHLVLSGLALASVEEYDVEKATWYCHAPLPHAFFGGFVATHGRKVYVIGGGDWFAISPTRRVQVIDLDRAPPPQPCAYVPTRLKDAWQRHYSHTKPFPEIDDQGSRQSHTIQGMVRRNYQVSGRQLAQQQVRAGVVMATESGVAVPSLLAHQQAGSRSECFGAPCAVRAVPRDEAAVMWTPLGLYRVSAATAAGEENSARRAVELAASEIRRVTGARLRGGPLEGGRDSGGGALEVHRVYMRTGVAIGGRPGGLADGVPNRALGGNPGAASAALDGALEAFASEDDVDDEELLAEGTSDDVRWAERTAGGDREAAAADVSTGVRADGATEVGRDAAVQALRGDDVAVNAGDGLSGGNVHSMHAAGVSGAREDDSARSVGAAASRTAPGEISTLASWGAPVVAGMPAARAADMRAKAEEFEAEVNPAIGAFARIRGGRLEGAAASAADREGGQTLLVRSMFEELPLDGGARQAQLQHTDALTVAGRGPGDPVAEASGDDGQPGLQRTALVGAGLAEVVPVTQVLHFRSLQAS